MAAARPARPASPPLAAAAAAPPHAAAARAAGAAALRLACGAQLRRPHLLPQPAHQPDLVGAACGAGRARGGA